MAIRNATSVYIDGINLTCFTVMPIKWGNLLDEQLDECYLSLRHCPIKNFKPLTPVEIHFSNELYFAETSVSTQKQIKRYVVANDTGATESPIGSNCWDHDLYIIEVTKIMECIVVDTITFTNDLGRNYTENPVSIVPDTQITTEVSNPATVFQDFYFKPTTPSTYKIPLGNNEVFYFESFINVFPTFWQQWQNYSWAGYPISPVYEPYMRISIKYNGDEIFLSNSRYSRLSKEWIQDENFLTPFKETLKTGNYIVEYRCELASYKVTSDITGETKYELDGYKYSLNEFNFLVVENRLPLKKWTITDAINRALDLAEPIRLGETPRFKLNEEQTSMFDNVLAPQFSFTKQTLRECLQECGKVIHGEPRLEIKKNENGKFYYEVLFDLYGQTEKSNIFHRKYIRNTVSQVIDSYASHLDSNAENLVNQLDKLAGVIVEPYRGGYKTVRTETMYVRITDANMIIPTQYPIYSIEKLECGYIPGYQDLGNNINLTPWVFEASVYNTQLSSYNSQYPYSKAYALSYTQGQKNITALNFKLENPISSVFESYSILNILRVATGNQNIVLPEYKYDPNNPEETVYSKYPLLAFRVTYTPFYNSRVGQTKTFFPDYPYGAALIYNQQSNVIESRYYGENLKGVIARIGNVEKSITYNLARLSDIPKAGQMYDDDYYISAVSVEYLPTYIKCTIGLSKDFNRLSQYIGISSVKRFSEVSQSQAVERNLLYREYIVVGKEETPDNDSLIGDNFMYAVADTFDQQGQFKPITNIVAWGSSFSRIALLPVQLPIISSAFGNSIAFSWQYEDNFSAGAISQWETNGEIGNKQVSGYFQNNYQYTDYYGRMYYYDFDLQKEGEQANSGNQDRIGLSLPESEIVTSSSLYFSTIGKSSYILRKDNREALQGNIQIDFVTNVQNLIIGSALAAYCPLVRGVDKSLAAKLYVFDEPLNKFINHVQGSLDVDLSTLPSMDIAINTGSGKFSVNAGNFPASGKAWAIVTQQSLGKEEKVEDEEGNVFTQSEVKGGDVLIAQNMEISAGQAFTPIYFTKKRKIFKEDVWTEIR